MILLCAGRVRRKPAGPAQVSIVVDPGIPLAQGISTNTPLNTAIALTLRGSDPQGSNLTCSIVTSPANGSLSGTPPNVTYTPSLDYNGFDTFKVNDGVLTRARTLVMLSASMPMPVRFILFKAMPFFVATLAPIPYLHAAYVDDWSRMKDITPRSYLCYQASAPVQIDGKLDDAAWKAAPWTENFVDIEGFTKPKPRLRTRAKMLWDDQYFYVAAELEEPHVWATLTNHDAVIFRDPDFEVFIDPDGDSHDYYEFEMNALNTGWDLRLPKPYKDGGSALNEWEIPGLKTAVHIHGTLNHSADRDRGWTLEIAFPWRALGEFARCPAPPREGDQWRVGFSRVEWLFDIIDGQYRKVPDKKEDNWVWSPQGIIDMHRPEKWGFVQFTKQKSGKTKFVPDPSTPARAVLQEVYYAQKDFQKVNKRWAASLAELKLADGLGSNLSKRPLLQTTPDGYRATAGIKLRDGHLQLWHIRQDAKVWSE